MEKAGFNAEAIHGNKSQNARQLALNNFKERKTRILVATDIAARGIDIEELSHVVNFDLPEVPETYVHRIGRTGRASHGGIAISFCSHEEKPLLKSILKLTSKPIKEVKDNPFPLIDTSSEKLVKPTGRTSSKKPVKQENVRGNRRKSEPKKDNVKSEKRRSNVKKYKMKIEEQ